MAVLENSKPKAEKTSASVATTFPRLCPTTKLDLKDIHYNHQKVKKLLPRSRTSSKENKVGAVDLSQTNFEKSKVTDTLDLNKSSKNSSKTASGITVTPRNYHGQIPVLSRHSLNLFGMSPPVTRSPSPSKRVNQKEKSSNKIKTITLEETKKKSKARKSRSPSPTKRGTSGNKKSNSRTSSSPTAGQIKNSEANNIKRADSSKQTSPRRSSPTKRKSKVFGSPGVELPVKNKLGKDLHRPGGDNNTFILKQTSHPSLFANEKIIQPQGKISLDHIKNEVYSGDHRRLSLEKVHLCIEETVENFKVAERKRSYLVTYSSEDIQKQEEISLSFLKNMSNTNIANVSNDIDQKTLLGEVAESKAAIRTLSGHELILTPSMKLDIDKEEESECLEISKILQDQAVNFDDKSELHILQDDENEYDSEVSTDGEAVQKLRQRSFISKKYDEPPSANKLWKSREADLLNDVDYRQSVYHPAVSRLQNTDGGETEFRPKSKSIEDNFGFPNNSGKRLVRTRSSLNNKFESRYFTLDKLDNYDRSWAPIFDKTDERQMYNSGMQDVPFYGESKSPDGPISFTIHEKISCRSHKRCFNRCKKNPNEERKNFRGGSTLHTQDYSSFSDI